MPYWDEYSSDSNQSYGSSLAGSDELSNRSGSQSDENLSDESKPRASKRPKKKKQKRIQKKTKEIPLVDHEENKLSVVSDIKDIATKLIKTSNLSSLMNVGLDTQFAKFQERATYLTSHFSSTFKAPEDRRSPVGTKVSELLLLHMEEANTNCAQFHNETVPVLQLFINAFCKIDRDDSDLPTLKFFSWLNGGPFEKLLNISLDGEKNMFLGETSGTQFWKLNDTLKGTRKRTNNLMFDFAFDAAKFTFEVSTSENNESRKRVAEKYLNDAKISSANIPYGGLKVGYVCPENVFRFGGDFLHYDKFTNQMYCKKGATKSTSAAFFSAVTKHLEEIGNTANIGSWLESTHRIQFEDTVIHDDFNHADLPAGNHVDFIDNGTKLSCRLMENVSIYEDGYLTKLNDRLLLATVADPNVNIPMDYDFSQHQYDLKPRKIKSDDGKFLRDIQYRSLIRNLAGKRFDEAKYFFYRNLVTKSLRTGLSCLLKNDCNIVYVAPFRACGPYKTRLEHEYFEIVTDLVHTLYKRSENRFTEVIVSLE